MIGAAHRRDVGKDPGLARPQGGLNRSPWLSAAPARSVRHESGMALAVMEARMPLIRMTERVPRRQDDHGAT
jgi:hypothetical protein